MEEKNNRFKMFQAVAVMVGYIVGVGMFGLPYLTTKAGFIAFFLFLIGLGFIQYLIHLVYSNLIIVTDSFHRLPGYVEKYLGKKAKNIAFASKMIGNYGALLAYFILIGIFLNELFQGYFGGTPFVYTIIAFIVSTIIVYFGIGIMAKAELVMSFLLFFIIIAMATRSFSSIESINFIAIDWKYVLLPYGAMLMALDGNGSLPIVAKILDKDPKKIKKVIRISLLTAIFITVLFVITVVGVSGSNTTPDALTGVKSTIKGVVITLALIFGVLTMLTSIIGVAESVKETYWWDYGVPKNLAFLLAVCIPFGLFLLGLTDLISVISFAGAIAGGVSAIMLILVFMHFKKMGKETLMFSYKPGKGISYIIIIFLGMGIVYEVFYFINKLI